VLSELATEFELRVTVPVRATGFDPLGDSELRSSLPSGVGEVLVPGHPAYLDESERRRAVAPRLEAATADASDPWIGTEGVERLALALGETQFDLLSTQTAPEVHALRTAGFDETIAVYAPTVLSVDEDEILDAVGAYAARRGDMWDALPDGAPRDRRITGSARETLLSACRKYALVGDPESVSRRVSELREVGVDYVIGYPAAGLDAVLGAD
jgi:hypothetical protein